MEAVEEHVGLTVIVDKQRIINGLFIFEERLFLQLDERPQRMIRHGDTDMFETPNTRRFTMSGLMEKLLPKAAAANLTLVLPEGNDPRVIKAAKIITERKLAKVKILATPDELKTSAEGICFCGNNDVEIIDWTKAPYFNDLAAILLERRKAKGMTEEESLKKTANRLFFGNLMVNKGLANGMVAGSIASTADMLRSAFNCIGTAKGIKTASSCFLMDLATPSPAGDDSTGKSVPVS